MSKQSQFIIVFVLASLILAIATPSFALTYQPPVIVRIEPVDARQDETFNLHVYGVNFQKKTTLEFRPSEGIEIKEIEVPLGGNHLIAKLYIKEDAPLGTRDLIVINPDRMSDVSTKIFTVLKGKLKKIPEVKISQVNFNPRGQDSGQEWIKIENFSQTPYSLKDWTISDRSGKVVAHLPDWQIPAGADLTIYFSRGTDDSDFSDGSAKFYTGRAEDFFGNEMDEAAIYAGNPSSDFIVDFLSWGKTHYQAGQAHNYALGAGIWEENQYLDISNLKEGEIISREEIEKFIGRAPIVRAEDLSSVFNSYVTRIPRWIRWFLGSGLAKGEFVFADGYQMPLALQIHRGEIIKVEPWVDDDQDGIPNVWERAEFYKVNFNLFLKEEGLKKLSDIPDWKDGLEKFWSLQVKYKAVSPNDKAKLALFNTGFKVYFFFKKTVSSIKNKFGK